MIHNDDLQLSLKFSCPVNNKLIYFVDFIPIGFLLVKLRWKVDLRGLIEEHESWDRTLCTDKIVLQCKIGNKVNPYPVRPASQLLKRNGTFRFIYNNGNLIQIKSVRIIAVLKLQFLCPLCHIFLYSRKCGLFAFIHRVCIKNRVNLLYAFFYFSDNLFLLFRFRIILYAFDPETYSANDFTFSGVYISQPCSFVLLLVDSINLCF